MKIKAVICDFDGTIMDSWPQALKIFKMFLKEFGGPLKNLKENTFNSFIRNMWGVPGGKILKLFFPDEPLETLIDKLIKCEKEIEPKPRIIEGFYETQEWLKNNRIILGLATNRRLNSLRRHLPIFNKDINRLFDFVQCYEDGPPSEKNLPASIHNTLFFSPYYKPNPMFLNQIIAWLANRNIQKESILHVGDTICDHQAAKGAGIHSCGVLTGPLDKKELWLSWSDIEEKFIIKSVADLPELIKNIG